MLALGLLEEMMKQHINKYHNNSCVFFSHSEAKRRLKAEQKEKEKALKVAEAAKSAPAAVEKITTGLAAAKINEDEISPNEYFKLRSAAVAELKKSPETDPYPHKFHVSISLENFIEKYGSLADGQTLEDVGVR